jgi:hypothetical protein
MRITRRQALTFTTMRTTDASHARCPAVEIGHAAPLPELATDWEADVKSVSELHWLPGLGWDGGGGGKPMMSGAGPAAATVFGA